MPLSYVRADTRLPNEFAGRDLSSYGSGQLIRHKIGGSRRSPLKKGGFVPSVMEGFASAASHYVTPLAMYAGYRFMNQSMKPQKKKKTRKGRK